MVQFQVRVLKTREDAGSEVGLMRIAKAVLETVRESPNAVQRAKLVEEAAGLLNLPPRALEEDLQHVMRRREQKEQREEQRGRAKEAIREARTPRRRRR